MPDITAAQRGRGREGRLILLASLDCGRDGGKVSGGRQRVARQRLICLTTNGNVGGGRCGTPSGQRLTALARIEGGGRGDCGENRGPRGDAGRAATNGGGLRDRSVIIGHANRGAGRAAAVGHCRDGRGGAITAIMADKRHGTVQRATGGGLAKAAGSLICLATPAEKGGITVR